MFVWRVCVSTILGVEKTKGEGKPLVPAGKVSLPLHLLLHEEATCVQERKCNSDVIKTKKRFLHLRQFLGQHCMHHMVDNSKKKQCLCTCVCVYVWKGTLILTS